MSILSKLAVAASIADLTVKKFFFDMLKVDTVVATGSLISDAAVLQYGRNVVTESNGTKAVRLPKADPDSKVEVVNTVAGSALIVFPELAGDQINAITAGAALTVPGGASATFYCDAAAHWYAAVATAATADTAELGYLDGALSTNLVAEKAAILGTGGALTLGGALTAVTSIGIGGAVLTEAEMEMLDTITAGQTAPSKAVVLDAAESLVWATTDATASETVTLSIQDTRTGPGATGWAHKSELVADVALGSYANALYGLVSLGASGKITGLGAGICGEMVLSAGCTDGTYACIEAEMGLPSGAATGTAASFMYLSLYGIGASAFDDSGYLFHLAGVTKNSGKLLQDVTSGATIRPVQVLKVLTPDGTRYLPLYSTAAIGA